MTEITAECRKFFTKDKRWFNPPGKYEGFSIETATSRVYFIKMTPEDVSVMIKQSTFDKYFVKVENT